MYELLILRTEATIFFMQLTLLLFIIWNHVIVIKSTVIYK